MLSHLSRAGCGIGVATYIGVNAVARGSSVGSVTVRGLLAVLSNASGYLFPSRTPLRCSFASIFSP